jgi:hypothetical protein
MYDISLDLSRDRSYLKSVFNFLLGMLITAAESSPNTSPAKPGLEQDERVKNFDQGIYVEVYEDIGIDDISTPITYHDGMEEDEMSDIIIEE